MTRFSAALKKQLYRSMLRIRICEESLVEPILSGEVRCPVHLYTGEEAVAAGICAALTTEDYLFGTHRSHGHYLAKGGDLKAMMAEIYCRETGCSHGRGGSMHLVAPEVGMLGSAPIVAGTISLALGAALASHIRGDERVTVSFFGDGATGEGVLYEALNFAALRKLPIIFACENNFYSTHLPISACRPATPIVETGRAFGVASECVDGNDVLAVHNVAKRAVRRCRSGLGPVFLELLTYRMRGHVGPDDNIQGAHKDIRPEAEIRAWRKKDPIRGLEKILLAEGILTRAEIRTIHREIEQEVAEAKRFAEQSPRPKEGEVARYVFG